MKNQPEWYVKMKAMAKARKEKEAAAEREAKSDRIVQVEDNTIKVLGEVKDVLKLKKFPHPYPAIEAGLEHLGYWEEPGWPGCYTNEENEVLASECYWESDIVVNQYGLILDRETVVSYMDDEIREHLHSQLAPCTEQKFFDAYCKAHEEKFGEPFIADDPSPMW